MGCCSSRPRGEQHPQQLAAVPAGYTPSSPHGLSPSQHPDSNHPAASSNSLTSSVGALRPVPLDQHYNAPLRPHVWKAKPGKLSTHSQWLKKREEFFDTRVTNRSEIWASLKTVVELLDQGEVETAQGILDACEVTLPTGDLFDGAYDSLGNLYHLPRFAISAPTNLIAEDDQSTGKKEVDNTVITGYQTLDPAASSLADKGKNKNIAAPQEAVDIKARLSDRGQDVVVTVGKDESTKALVAAVAAKAGLPQDKVRIAYMGRVLKPGKSFTAQGWQVGHVVNALVTQ